MKRGQPPKPPIVPSKSRDLVALGPRHLSAKNRVKRDENGDKPTTVRALVLRNGKYGARGTGEMILVKKITGREKLDLLAADLVEQSKTAVLRPFRLEHCLKIAKSQFNAYLDEIANLQDPDLFYSLIEAEYKARKPQKNTSIDLWRNSAYIASIIATRIHNTYFFASAWHIVLDTLQELEGAGLSDRTFKIQLEKNEGLRSRYLVLYDMVNVLVNTSQAKFSLLATTTPHYSRYFKHADSSDPNDPEVVFDWGSLRDACKSFLDSIIIELCFPRAPYPKHILYQILHDAVGESPKEANRFPQALWDAVGDLSVTVELLDLLERPLMGPDGDAWKQLPRQMSERYERWVDAQIYSEKASNESAKFKDIVHPLELSKKRPVLQDMWKLINLNYKEVSGMDIDTLWQLNEERNRTPQWHSFYVPKLRGGSDDDSELFQPPSRGRKKPLAIKDTADSSSGSMPGLQSVSNSSEQSSDSEDESDDGDDSPSEYDTEEEDDMRDMLREAMDIVHEDDEIFFGTSGSAPEIDQFVEERKGNPFLKLLGSLRGRMFSANPKLKATGRTELRSPGAVAKPAVPGTEVGPIQAVPIAGDKKAPEPTQSHKTTVDDAVDEDDVSRSPKKKKKSHKKKKKKKPSSSEVPTEQGLSTVPESTPASPSLVKDSAPVPQPSPTVPASPPKKQPSVGPTSPRSSVRSPSTNASTTTLPHMSTASLGIPVEQTSAQSARSYLHAENLDLPKSKVKSRPEQPPPPLAPIPEKKGMFSKLMRGKDKVKEVEPEMEGSKHSWFSRMNKKTKEYMHQILRTSEDKTQGIAPMKWDHFLKVMREMGFKLDPSTAGSSVRFDPPDKRDKPITIHKPHPDTTLQPVMIKNISKRLKHYYGWCEEDFIKHT